MNEHSSDLAHAGPWHSGAGVRDAALAYSTALSAAGGEQVDAFVRAGSPRAVCAALYRSPPYELHVPALKVSRLSLNLTASRVSGAIDGESTRAYEAGRYSLFMTPAGAGAHWTKQAPSRHLAIYYGAEALSGEDVLSSPLVESRPLMNLAVPGLRPLVDQLVEELRRADNHHADAADSLTRLLLIQVSRHLRRTRLSARVISQTTTDRLRAYVWDHLDDRILVADLAAQAGMAIDSFAVAFKLQTGLSPHQFVLTMRLEHARALLRTSSLSLAEVALACGFSSQQHMTNTMHRTLGTTPARYRDTPPTLPGGLAQS